MLIKTFENAVGKDRETGKVGDVQNAELFSTPEHNSGTIEMAL